MSAYSFWFQTSSRNLDDVHGHPGRLISSGVAKNYRAADGFPRLSTVWIGGSNKSKDETAGTRFGAKWQRSSWPQEEPYASDFGPQIVSKRPMSVRRAGVFDHFCGKTSLRDPSQSYFRCLSLLLRWCLPLLLRRCLLLLRWRLLSLARDAVSARERGASRSRVRR